MNKFAPATGGHDLHLDDFVLMQNAYFEGFKALIYKFGNTGNVILDGVETSISGSNLVWTEGFVALKGELFTVPAGAISYTSGGTLYVAPEESTIAPSPTLYEDGGLKNVHLQRIGILKYKAGDTNGEDYDKMIRPGVHLPGDFQPWMVPPGRTLSEFFDATGKGIGVRTGWHICNGLGGTPDLRGFSLAQATDVPASGAPTFNDTFLSALRTVIGEKKGANLFKLLKEHLPAYDLTVIDPGHKHGLTPDAGRQEVARSGAGTALRTENYPSSVQTTTNVTNIKVNSAGSDTPHDVRQPTFYCYMLLKLS